jgi:hypothetical protein
MGCDKAVADRAQEIHGAAKNYYDANLSYAAIRRRTEAAVLNPQIGDRYHEMYSYWSYVVHVTDGYVFTMSAPAPCEFPQDGKLEKWTLARFAKSYAELDFVDNSRDMIENERWFLTAMEKLDYPLVPHV